MIREIDCSTGKIVERAETAEELAQFEADKLAAVVPIDTQKIELAAIADRTFYELAEDITAEHIDALKIQEWQAKEHLVSAWILDDKPTPAVGNKYALAWYEAQGDPDKDASQLMESWLVNATNWRQLNTAYIAWRQDFRHRVSIATDEAALMTLQNGIDGELQTLLGIG